MGKCYHTTVVAAPLDKVWATIRDFHDLDWATGVITKVEPVGDVPGNAVGAKRVLNDVFHETLQTLDEANHGFSYTIDNGPGPLAPAAVTRYVGRVRLLPVTDDDTTLVEWRSDYETADDSAVAVFCNPIYVALLAALKKFFAG